MGYDSYNIYVGSENKKILLIEDEVLIALSEAQMLERNGYDVVCLNSGEEAVAYALETEELDLILMDINLGRGMSGTTAAELILAKKDIPLIFLSSHTEKNIVEKTEGITSYGYVVKDSSETVLTAAIKMAFKLHESNLRIASEKDRYRDYLDSSLEGCQIIGFDWKYIYLNKEAEKHNRRPNTELVGQVYTEMWPGIAETEVYLKIKDSLENRTTHQMDNFFIFPDGQTGWYRLNIRPVREGVFISSIDITQHKLAQEERQTVVDFLQLVNNCRDSGELLKKTILFFKHKSGFQAVGIRLKSGEDYPYLESIGFSDEFIEHENKLCSYDCNEKMIRDEQERPVLACMCGNVIQGRFDPQLPFFSEKGSFWANNTTRLLALTSDKDRQAKTRNYCNGVGYESVGLFALRDGATNWGLLQLNDTRTNRFNRESVLLWERLADYLAVALSKSRIKENLFRTQKRASAYLEEYRSFFNLVPDLVCIASMPDGRFTKLNSHWTRVLGYSLDALMSQSFLEFIHPEDRKETIGIMEKLTDGEDAIRFVNRYRTAAGDYRFFEWMATPVLGNRLFAVARDITDARKIQVRQKELIAEKQMLLDELQHRAKNSFNMINSMIQLTAESIQKKDLEAVLNDLRVRIGAIAEMYDLLYQNELIENVSLSDYLGKVANLINMSNKTIRIQVDVESVHCTVKLAIPLGIISAELLTNAAKYAYPKTDQGVVSLELKKRDEDVILQVHDYGIGLPVDFDPEKSSTLGYKIIRALVRQVDGEFLVNGNGGTHCSLKFRILRDQENS